MHMQLAVAQRYAECVPYVECVLCVCNVHYVGFRLLREQAGFRMASTLTHIAGICASNPQDRSRHALDIRVVMQSTEYKL